MTDSAPDSTPDSFYAAVGGHETFDGIVRAFYVGVRIDPVLAPMYPEDDFDGAIERLTLFLSQYWEGRQRTRSSAGTRGCALATRPST